jgi:hypothetical protein
MTLRFLRAGRPRRDGPAAAGSFCHAHLIDIRAPDLVHPSVLDMQANAFAGRRVQSIRVYPTFALGIQMAAGMLFPAEKATIGRREGPEAAG